jgi:hypothetical protein
MSLNKMKKLFTGAIIVLVAASIFFAFASYRGCGDTSFHDDDLRISRVDLAPSNNAYTYFCLATNTLCFPYDTYHTYYKLTESLKSNIWDEAAISGILASNETMLACLETGLVYSTCQSPAITNIYTPMPFIAAWRNMARIMSLKTKSLFHDGKQEQAFENATKTIKFGHVIEESSETMIQFLVGIAVKGIGLSDLEEMATSSTIPSDRLKHYGVELSRYGAAGNGLTNAYKGDYHFQCLHVDALANGRTSFRELISIGPSVRDESKRSFRLPYYVFQPENTKELLAATARRCIAEIQNTYDKMDKNLVERNNEQQRSLHQWLLPNSIGIILHNMLVPAVGAVLEKKLRYETYVRALQAILATKAFRQDNNRLPESLDELVPAYLHEIPVDPYDGKSLKYSQGKKIVYSVGKDLKDSGGSEKQAGTYTNRWTTEDIVFKIEF